MARIRQAEGDPAGALELLNEAERLYVGDFFRNVRPVPALKARVWIAQGRLGEALGWAREQGLSVDDELSYLREFEHITLARMLLARYQDDRAEHSLHQATRLLERLLRAAEEGQRTGRVIEILVLQALTRQRLGDIPAALACLERGVTLAEPEGYGRVFIDEGPAMASLLRAAAKQGTAGNYVRRLLAAVSETGHDSPVKQALIEPLSERELDVLRLLGTELDGPDIAGELMVSLNTVRNPDDLTEEDRARRGHLLLDHLHLDPPTRPLRPVKNHRDWILSSGSHTGVLVGAFLEVIVALAGT